MTPKADVNSNTVPVSTQRAEQGGLGVRPFAFAGDTGGPAAADRPGAAETGIPAPHARLKLPIRGVGARLIRLPAGDGLLVESERPLATLSSVPWGGGFGKNTAVLNRQVDKTYLCDDPVAEMREYLDAAGLPVSGTAGMLTAAWVREAGYCALCWRPGEAGGTVSPAALPGEPGAGSGTEGSAEADPAADDGALTVCAFVTVGLSNKARAGEPAPAAALYPGTINTIVIVNAAMTDSAMVNAVITATEAKAAALQDLGVTTASGRAATGTTTDAVVIASAGEGYRREYAGTATRLGHLIGRAVYEAAAASGAAYSAYVASRGGGTA